MAQKRKAEDEFLNNQPSKKRKMSDTHTTDNNKNVNEGDSDSDFDPNSVQKPEEPKVHKHRYRTRSTTATRTQSSNENEDEIEEETVDPNAANKNNKKGRGRGRPKKPKRRKKKSNHIEIKKPSRTQAAIKERLSKMDQYDTQQYISSVVANINNGLYEHPFFSKPTTMPKRRVKKIMKLDPENFVIAHITVELMGILIDLFVKDLVCRSYKYTIKDNRKSLQLQDICRAVQSDHMYDFLIDIVPRIKSYDQQNNVYNFIYSEEMQNCILTKGALANYNNDQNENSKKEQDETSNDRNMPAVRRSKRIKSKRSDKEEAD